MLGVDVVELVIYRPVGRHFLYCCIHLPNILLIAHVIIDFLLIKPFFSVDSVGFGLFKYALRMFNFGVVITSQGAVSQASASGNLSFCLLQFWVL